MFQQLEKTLENPMDCKEIKPVNPKGNQVGTWSLAVSICLLLLLLTCFSHVRLCETP